MPSNPQPVLESIAFELDGRTVEARDGETILHAARRHGVAIPTLCYSDGLRRMRAGLSHRRADAQGRPGPAGDRPAR